MSAELERLLQTLPEPGLLLEATGRILAANAAAAGLVDLGRAGMDFQALVADPPDKVRSFLRLCARSRQLVPGTFDVLGRDGRTTRVRCQGAVVTPGSGDSPALLYLRCRPQTEASDPFILLNRQIEALSKEVLERKKIQQQRDALLESERAARQEAERIGRLKDEFLATLSHELRTPLHAILGWVQVLLHPGARPADAQAALRSIERNARSQAKIIEDLLDMSRIISGRVRLELRPLRLDGVIEAAVESIRPQADAKRLTLNLVLDRSLGAVEGDADRLQQIVWNLLSNAVKFTPEGGRIDVSLQSHERHARIVVRDTGEGIPTQFLPHVFDRFRQADASRTRRHGGLGLGLSIARQLTELHHGTVQAESAGEGKGATFSVTLPLLGGQEGPSAPPRTTSAPLAAGQRPPGASFSGAASGHQLCGLRVLVVDDEADARELMRGLLEAELATVTTAGSATEALSLIREAPPDVLLCDIAMPGMDGHTLIRQIRTLPAERGGNVRAVAVTALARQEDRDEALSSGFDEHLAKPVDRAALVRAVKGPEGLGPRSDWAR